MEKQIAHSRSNEIKQHSDDRIELKNHKWKVGYRRLHHFETRDDDASTPILDVFTQHHAGLYTLFRYRLSQKNTSGSKHWTFGCSMWRTPRSTSFRDSLSNFKRTETAIYLPRLAFLNKTTDQIKDNFIMQDNYVKSLHQIPLSPMVSNIDTMRIEYFPDGTSMERTTREWALSLNLANGNQAQCDVENGGKDKLTYLLAPAAYAAEVKSMVTQYKDRLQTIAKREARFRESLPDLPEVIHYSNKPGLPR